MELHFHHPNLGRLTLRTSVPADLPLKRPPLDRPDEIRFAYEGMQLSPSATNPAAHPLFFEWQDVLLTFEAVERPAFQPPVHVEVNGLDVELYSQAWGTTHGFKGSLNFEQAIGNTDIQLVDRGGKALFTLKSEVFPSKMAYKRDFHHMLAELANDAHEAIFRPLQKTFLPTTLQPDASPAPVAWIAVLKASLQTLEQSLEAVRLRPHRELRAVSLIKPANQVRRAPLGLDRWAGRHPQHLHPNRTHPFLASDFQRLPEQQKAVQFDTPPNQWLRTRLLSTLRTLDEHLHAMARTYRHRKHMAHEIQQLRTLHATLHRYAAPPPLSQVSHGYLREPNLAQLPPAYRRLQQVFHHLQMALRLSPGGLFRLDARDVASVYEAWCLLKVSKLIESMPGFSVLPSAKPHEESSQTGLSGQAERVFVHSSGDRLELVAQPRLAAGTFTQIPDILLTLYKQGQGVPFRLFLDAKYRLNRQRLRGPDTPYAWGPPPESLAQLHRYRDAVHFGEKVRGPDSWLAEKALGGVVLFPYPEAEENFRSHPFFQRISRSGIGAIPLHPGSYQAHRLLYEYLRNFLYGTLEELQEQMVDYKK